MLTYNVA